MVQSSRPKDKAEVGSSMRTNNLTDNTRMDYNTESANWEQQQYRNNQGEQQQQQGQATIHRPERGILHRMEKRGSRVQQVGCNPHKIIRKPVQGKEACKKRKYITEDPVITLTEDDADLVTDKVQDRGEEVVCIAEVQ
jgi:hypothetical protein